MSLTTYYTRLFRIALPLYYISEKRISQIIVLIFTDWNGLSSISLPKSRKANSRDQIKARCNTRLKVVLINLSFIYKRISKLYSYYNILILNIRPLLVTIFKRYLLNLAQTFLTAISRISQTSKRINN